MHIKVKNLYSGDNNPAQGYFCKRKDVECKGQWEAHRGRGMHSVIWVFGRAREELNLCENTLNP